MPCTVWWLVDSLTTEIWSPTLFISLGWKGKLLGFEKFLQLVKSFSDSILQGIVVVKRDCGVNSSATFRHLLVPPTFSDWSILLYHTAHLYVRNIFLSNVRLGVDLHTCLLTGKGFDDFISQSLIGEIRWIPNLLYNQGKKGKWDKKNKLIWSFGDLT